ncbi:MAG: stage II sporulation protein D [Bacilli bacterium]|nr:stage II sporulation protein D [Bacilli bacterium]
MKNKILLLIILVLSVIAVISFKNNGTNFNLGKNKVTLNLKDSDTGSISNVELENYIIGVVAAEMPASFNEEALKAQAIASRTYAMYKINNAKGEYDLVTDVSDQSYITIEEMKDKWNDDFDKYYTKVASAVDETKSLVMKYEDEIISAYYFAMSNGYTEDASLVFNESKPYLKSTESKWEDESINNFSVTKTFNLSEFCTLLNVSEENIVITDVIRSDTNRVNQITINNQPFSGTEVRKLLGLRSTDFEITVTETEVLITTNGYGHGVGMSQYGANYMAKEGYTYDEILKYYYDGIEIGKI